MTRKKKSSRLTMALLETASDMRRVGILDSASHEKITMRHLGGKADKVRVERPSACAAKCHSS
jgi:hypothetical protein